MESSARAVRARVLVTTNLQYLSATAAVDPKVPDQPSPVVHGFKHRPDRDVAGAVRHCCGEPAARLPDFFLGHVLPDALGLDDVYWNAWIFPGCHVLVPAHPPHDLDLRDAHLAAAGGGESRMKRTPIYGMLAEFDSPTDLVDAA